MMSFYRTLTPRLPILYSYSISISLFENVKRPEFTSADLLNLPFQLKSYKHQFHNSISEMINSKYRFEQGQIAQSMANNNLADFELACQLQITETENNSNGRYTSKMNLVTALTSRHAENFSVPSKDDYELLELADPCPDVNALFVQYSKDFFNSKLDCVELKWSKRMKMCAGTCTFKPSQGSCVITLSECLLKFRSRKETIETLLHEMIHAYLFITQRNTDRDGHGPIFQSHMNRVNRVLGLKITIYHSFSDEVELYRQHWWKCNGPCQYRRPYYGIVKRSMNRPPGPNDYWWGMQLFKCYLP
ncbi:hypothetical protein GJ496_004584 [Pomphorhynchus laevis]|nr:hypothetical protein GJ496_004584 [Pomphorhynchus laevis]